MYLPVAEHLLRRRDRWLDRQPNRALAMEDTRSEVLGSARIDWVADLQRLEAECRSRSLPIP